MRALLQISIHTLRVEGDDLTAAKSARLQAISIHTLRVEGDSLSCVFHFAVFTISIHTLRVEGDSDTIENDIMLVLFQSTPSVWRVTSNITSDRGRIEKISIHTLRVEGDSSAVFAVAQSNFISIHTLRVEGDSFKIFNLRFIPHFNPHPPCGG